MKVWTDKQGNKLDAKEFKERFKLGVEKVTPLQQARIGLIGQMIILVGVITGIIVNILAHLWWLLIILGGTLFVVSVSTIGAYQKYLLLKRLDDTLKGGQDEQESTT